MGPSDGIIILVAIIIVIIIIEIVIAIMVVGHLGDGGSHVRRCLTVLWLRPEADAPNTSATRQLCLVF